MSWLPTTTAVVVTLALLLAAYAPSSNQAFIVTNFPHFQTFDYWNNCSWMGACYAQACVLKDGWTNIAENHTMNNWWVQANGPTTSNRNPDGTPFPCSNVLTGPCGDHSPAGNGTGQYLYAEATACEGVVFQLTSPVVVFTNSGATMSFWYYMFGGDLDDTSIAAKGSLAVKMAVNGGAFSTNLVNLVGQQQTFSGAAWQQFSAVLDSHFPAAASSPNPVKAQFQFTAKTPGAIVGDDNLLWRSDIAIDDFVVTQAGASTVLVPFVSPTNSTSTGGGGGLDGGQIAGIIVGVIVFFILFLLLLAALGFIVLAIVSPKKPTPPVTQAA